jgi:hypothetical protein
MTKQVLFFMTSPPYLSYQALGFAQIATLAKKQPISVLIYG